MELVQHHNNDWVKVSGEFVQQENTRAGHLKQQHGRVHGRVDGREGEADGGRKGGKEAVRGRGVGGEKKGKKYILEEMKAR